MTVQLSRTVATLLAIVPLVGAGSLAHVERQSASSLRAGGINRKAVFHDELSTVYRKPFGAVPAGTRVTLRLRTAHNGATSVTLQTATLNAQGSAKQGRAYRMKRTRRGKRFDIWSGGFTPKQVSMYGYRFLVRRGSAKYTYGKLRFVYGGGESCQFTAQVADPYFELTSYAPSFQAPSWAKDAIFYQIFPDRFSNGDPSNDRKVMDPVYGGTHPYFHTSESDAPLPGGEDFYGGDLQGVIDKLPYLKGLGVTALYLNPIFLAPSNHKYDTSDYYTIDPHFGTMQTLTDLLTKAHALGMRVILDGVFNHTGSDSIYFNRYGTFPDVGAAQSQSSPYFPLYRFTAWPNSYATFCGVSSLPQIQETDAAKEFIFRAPNSVAQYWPGKGTDGWRLDAASQKSHSWWQQFRTSLKARFPDTILIGENTIDPRDSTQYLLGTEMDGVMNYRFRDSIERYFAANINSQAGIPSTTSQLWSELMDVVQSYPIPAQMSSMNLLDSHDTSRILTDLGGNVQELKLVATLQMTWLGAPTIYYGDEAGLQGQTDPDDRRFFPWNNQNTDLETFYRVLTAARSGNTALRDGSIAPLVIDDRSRVLSFLRRDATTFAAVAINDGKRPRTLAIALPADRATATMVDALTGTTYAPVGGKVTMQLAGKTSAVLVPAS